MAAEGGGVSAEANTVGGFFRKIRPAETLLAGERSEELAAQVTELRKELADANAATAQ